MSMIERLEGAARTKAAPFFDGSRETMVWSCLDGSMGEVWTDSGKNPRSVQLLIGDFCFFGGAPHAELAANLRGRDRALAADPPAAWGELLARAYAGRCRLLTRYAIRKDTNFDRERLRGYIAALPAGYRLRPIGGEDYSLLQSLAWARDFCSVFQDAADYARRGLGFLVLYQGDPVAGASSYTVYRGGIEIEIDTRRDHCRRGLALCCASALILRCLERGLYPSWDAATPVSVSLAEKLGYRFDREYPAYLLSREDLC